jgi:hypothetical protein
MNEELEKKLTELLGLKKQMEEATSEQHKKNISSVLERYKKESRLSLIRSLFGLVMSIVLQLIGVLGLYSTQVVILGHDISGTPFQYFLGAIFMLFGVLIFIITVITACIRYSKLQILAELKQFELRLAEMLKK